MPKYILHYFNVRGLAEISRLILHYVGVDFEDKRYALDDWKKIKQDRDQFPFLQLPVLEVDGKIICQSYAIARYLANEFGLAGSNNLERARCDSLVYEFKDMFFNFFDTVYMERDAKSKEEAKTEFYQTYLPDVLLRIEKVLSRNNNGTGFLVESKVTWADFLLVTSVDTWGKNILDNTPLLKALEEKVRGLPNIQRYLLTRPKTAS